MNNRGTQKKELAGKTKLTAVSIRVGIKTYSFFVPLFHDANGTPHLPISEYTKLLDQTDRMPMQRVMLG